MSEEVAAAGADLATIARLTAERDAALAELRSQRELWVIAKPMLDLMDARQHLVKFTELHDPIGAIDRVLRNFPPPPPPPDAAPWPSQCKHAGALFISSERGPGAQRRHASVCPHCGRFRVWVDGALMTFELVSDEQVRAAGVYARSLSDPPPPPDAA